MNSFLELAEFVQLECVLNIVNENADTFEYTPLSKWTEKVEQY